MSRQNKTRPTVPPKPKHSSHFIQSLNFALEGIIYAFRTERNLKIHLAVALVTLVVCLKLNLTLEQFLLVIFAMTLVMLTEMFNTAVEAMVNLLTMSHHPLAKIAKDVAAGGVVIACLNAMVVAYFLMIRPVEHPIYQTVFVWIRSTPLHVLGVLLGVLFALVLVVKAAGRQGTFTQGGIVSGHAMVAFGLATAVLWLTQNTLATSLSFLLAALVAQSRVEGRIHRWSEVVFGALIGIVTALLIFKIFHS